VEGAGIARHEIQLTLIYGDGLLRDSGGNRERCEVQTKLSLSLYANVTIGFSIALAATRLVGACRTEPSMRSRGRSRRGRDLARAGGGRRRLYFEHGEPQGRKPERGEPEGRKPEREGPYTKLVALGTILLVVIGYVGLAYTVHWSPYSTSNPGSTSSPPAIGPTVTGSQSTATGTGTQSATGIPVVYQGTWQGNIVQVNTAAGTNTGQVSITLGQGADGSQVGEFTSNTPPCQASVYLEGGDGPIFLRLITTSNPTGECAQLSYVRVTLTSSGLYFVFEQSSEVSPNEPVANVAPGDGTLVRSS
jgi:hypothetical protein